MTTVSHVPPALPAGLFNAPAVARKRAKQRQGTHGKHHHIVPDETILAMRRMHEIERKPMHIVMRAYPQFSETYVRHVLGYILRANLRVRP